MDPTRRVYAGVVDSKNGAAAAAVFVCEKVDFSTCKIVFGIKNTFRIITFELRRKMCCEHALLIKRFFYFGCILHRRCSNFYDFYNEPQMLKICERVEKEKIKVRRKYLKKSVEGRKDISPTKPN